MEDQRWLCPGSVLYNTHRKRSINHHFNMFNILSKAWNQHTLFQSYQYHTDHDKATHAASNTRYRQWFNRKQAWHQEISNVNRSCKSLTQNSILASTIPSTQSIVPFRAINRAFKHSPSTRQSRVPFRAIQPSIVVLLLQWVLRHRSEACLFTSLLQSWVYLNMYYLKPVIYQMCHFYKWSWIGYNAFWHQIDHLLSTHNIGMIFLSVWLCSLSTSKYIIVRFFYCAIFYNVYRWCFFWWLRLV